MNERKGYGEDWLVVKMLVEGMLQGAWKCEGVERWDRHPTKKEEKKKEEKGESIDRKRNL